jgi:tol-pal system protein YbgF
MKPFRLNVVALCLLLAMAGSGCWGRKWYRAPGETLETGSKVDSLLSENDKLQRRVYYIERMIKEQEDYSRTTNTQFKMDIEELKDEVNILQEMLRQLGLRVPYQVEEGASPDAAPVDRGGAVGRFGGEEVQTASADSALMANDRAPADSARGAAEIDTTASAVGKLVPSPQEIQRQIYLDFSRGEYQLALDGSEAFLDAYPDHPLGEEVHFIRGECFIEQEKYFDSLKEFSIILKKYPHGTRVPASLLRMAVSYEKIGEEELAAGIAKRLIKEYPYSEEAAAAQDQFGELLKD